MNKKGFTLVELLAVIVILGIILAIAIPVITGLIESSRKNAFESDVKMVLSAIRYKMLEDDTFDVEGINQTNVVEFLEIPNVNYNNISVTIEEGILNVMVIGRNRWDGLMAYGTSARITVIRTDEYDVEPPVITLLGQSQIVVEQGSIYVDAGATAFDNMDGDITYRISVNNIVDTSIIGVYTVTYNVSDNSGNVAETVIRTVTVIDSEPPVITMLGQSSVVIPLGSIYTDAGATASDNIDGDLTANIIVISNVNPSQTGNYTVTYNVSDSVGNAAIPVVRAVSVIPNVYTFSSAGNSGRTGPTQAQINTAYSGTSLAGSVTVNGGIQLWTAPYTGTYRIEAWGAQGGGSVGGQGARMRGDFSLSSQSVLKILVGQRGLWNYGGGGGGGTFVTYSNNSPLIIAGAGGGQNYDVSWGQSGQITTSGGRLNTSSGVPGNNGTGGGHGLTNDGGCGWRGSGGGGLTSNGGLSNDGGGFAFINGGNGGTNPSGNCVSAGLGGFGGGGAGGNGGGAGGGYSGGGGGSNNPYIGGGGGGSYNAGSNPSNSEGVRTGNGLVIITLLP